MDRDFTNLFVVKKVEELITPSGPTKVLIKTLGSQAHQVRVLHAKAAEKRLLKALRDPTSDAYAAYMIDVDVGDADELRVICIVRRAVSVARDAASTVEPSDVEGVPDDLLEAAEMELEKEALEQEAEEAKAALASKATQDYVQRLKEMKIGDLRKEARTAIERDELQKEFFHYYVVWTLHLGILDPETEEPLLSVEEWLEVDAATTGEAWTLYHNLDQASADPNS